MREDDRPGPGWAALALIGALLVYGNGCAWLDQRRGGPTPTSFNWAHMAMLGISLLLGRADRLSLEEQGLTPAGAGRSAMIGCALGSAGLLVTRLWLSLGVVQRQFGLPNFEELRGRRLAQALCLQFLLGSAVFEEVAFRGVLHAQLRRGLGSTEALIAGSGVFALWHALVVWYNVGRLSVHPALVPLAYSGVLGVLFGVGILLASLRDRTGNLLGGIIVHWALVAGMVLAIPRKGVTRQ